MSPRTPAEIRQRLQYAAWFGSKSEAMHCYGCGEFEMCRVAYNGGAHMNFGACASCRAIAERRETEQEFEAERDRAVQLLADAAKRITDLGAAATQGKWETGGIGDHGWSVYCTAGSFGVETEDSEQGRADAAWIALAAPAIAPFISGWLAKVASIAAIQERRDDFEVYVDKKALGLAEHVMAVPS